MPDIRQLLRDAAPRHVAPVDLERVERRVERRRVVRAAAGTAVAAAVVVTALLAAPTSSLSDRRPVVGTPPSSVPTTSTTSAPTDGPSAPVPMGPYTGAQEVHLEDFPAMGAEGLAVDTPYGVAFVGLDRHLHGMLRDAVLDDATPAAGVPGLVAVTSTRSGTDYWVDPRNGGAIEQSVGTPVGYDTLLVDRNGDLVLDPHDEFLGVEADSADDVRLSARHRMLTWSDCDDDTDPGDCPQVRFADLDMGGTGTVPNGCWFSDKFADMNTVATCWQPWNGESWLQISRPGASGPQEVRVDVPVYAGAPGPVGHFTKAFFTGDGLAAELSLECETRRVVGVRGSEIVGLFGDRWEDGPNAHLLGVAPAEGGDRPVVHVKAGACDDDADVEPGVYVVQEDGSLQLVLFDPDLTAVQMWSQAPDIPAIRRRDGR